MSSARGLPSPTEVPSGAFGSQGAVTTPLTAREWVVTVFAAVILGVIALIAFFLLWEGRAAAPSLNGLTPDLQKQVIANYKDVVAVLGERMEKTFDLLITKGLLPVFATLIGFLLGKQRTEGS